MDVLFAVMPFADLGRPALGVSLLKAGARLHGFQSTVRYYNFTFAEAIGLPTYSLLANAFPPDSLIGEWVFADLLADDGELPDATDYADRVLSRYGVTPQVWQEILNARRSRANVVARCVAEIAEAAPAVVGFTTTFHQTCACLAVARGLKQLPKPPVIVFGGANCEGSMGLQLLRTFPCIDYVCVGEGDRAFPSWLQGLLTDGEAPAVPGMLGRDTPVLQSAPLIEDLDALPVPEFDDYFARYEVSPLKPEIRPDILIETSRGCWWGAKKHCTFCGLNGDTMRYRSKSPERTFSEMQQLSTRYGIKRIESVDNILDMRYIRTVFPWLAESGLDLELFYEVKANLRLDQLRVLRNGGLTFIQPGIESFSDQVLDLMEKGCSGLQNIQLLRWSAELGIRVAWNILYGFPGESPSEYEAMAELVPKLVHLPPPAACSPFRLDRFSPFYTRGSQLGITRMRPAAAYYYVFPFGKRDLEALAYYFDFDFNDGRNPHSYTKGLGAQVQAWCAQQTLAPSSRAQLDARCVDGEILITDTRPCAVAAEHQLQGLDAQLYLRCDSAQTLAGLQQRTLSAPADDVAAHLQQLVARKLMVEIRGRYLSLAVLRSRPTEPSLEFLEDADVQRPTPPPAQPLLHPLRASR